ncbi:hypothetical protein [Amycolatopsis sp. NPDC054798]
MTPPTAARSSRFATRCAQQEAHAAAELIAEAGGQVTLGGVELGDEVRDLLRQIIAIVAEGGTVTVGAMPEIITTTVADDVLAFRRERLRKQRDALNELLAIEDRFGVE